jgi:hypothetical protein
MINNENVIPCFINMPSLYGDVLCLKELLRADSIVNAVSFQTNSNNIFALVLR